MAWAGRRHPYVVVYVTFADHLAIVAVAHTSRRPGYWLTRVPDVGP